MATPYDTDNLALVPWDNLNELTNLKGSDELLLHTSAGEFRGTLDEVRKAIAPLDIHRIVPPGQDVGIAGQKYYYCPSGGAFDLYQWEISALGVGTWALISKGVGDVPADRPTVTLLLITPVPAGQPLTLNATASEQNATVVMVEFFDGSTFLGSATSSPYSYTIPQVTQGLHFYTAKATDSGGRSAVSALQQISIAAAGSTTPANILPQAQAGAAQTITQPTSSVNLSGGGSDSDGSVVSRQWEQVNGPVQTTIANGTTYAPTISGLTSVGTYTFRLTVTDDRGGTGHADVTVTVQAAPVTTTFSQTLNPGDNVATLTFDAQSQGQLLYNSPVQATASSPGANAVSFFYPDLNTQVGYLNYDPLDENHACAYKLGGVTYLKNASTGATLSWVNGGNILLGN